MTRGKSTNPLTNLEFSKQDIVHVIDVAEERFPLSVTIFELIGKQTVVETTKLSSVLQLAIDVYNAKYNKIVVTPFELIQGMVDRGRFMFPFFGKSISMMQALLLHSNVNLVDLVDGNKTNVYCLNLLSPPQGLQQLEEMIAYSQEEDLPFEYLSDRYIRTKRYICETKRLGEEFDRRCAEMKALKVAKEN